MIIEGILNLIFGLVYELASAIPSTIYNLPNWLVTALKLIKTGLGIFPKDVWIIVISNGLFWLSIQFTWAIIEWLYKKIPGVD